MTMPILDGYARLTEKEKQTLRLIVRGHDAKSIARHLDLSVHTINERLRDARRKLAVPSSRAAARLLLDHEGAPAPFGPQSLGPEFLGDEQIGEAGPGPAAAGPAGPPAGARRAFRPAGLIIGAVTMILALAALVLAVQPAAPPASNVATTAATDAATEAAARRFLALVDAGRWDDSYRATGPAFQKLNSARVWAEVSQKVRPPLGAMLDRTLLSQEELPAPPRGYTVVKFRTNFANKAGAVETVTLDRVGTDWRVVGIYVE